ncbi:MAG: putative aminoglycoside phosphotransferase [Solirubrobacterales bacterium]|nr:putative aminoglycoside phosphotransferase [Solirubrobacterales bacterium]
MTAAASPPDSVVAAISRFAAGRPVGAVTPMPGHAGFSYGVDVGGEPFVLRVPPPGVKHEGPADVLRQARLLELLVRTGVPVPEVRGVGEGDEPWFVVDRLPGTTIRPTDDGPIAFAPSELARLGLESVDALAAIHRCPVPDWLGPPRRPAETVRRWDAFAARSAEPALLLGADGVRDRLLARAPAAPQTGIVHGDFQWGNILAGPPGAADLLAVIDWELAHHGSVLDDLGWLIVFSDTRFWAGDTMVVAPGLPEPEHLIDRYGTTPLAVAWHVALAAYAFAVIIGLNLMLHRRGKRHDPLWEQLAPSAPVLLACAAEQLDGPPSLA